MSKRRRTKPYVARELGPVALAQPETRVDGGQRHNDPYIEVTLEMRSSTWDAMLAALPESPERTALFAALKTAKANAEAQVADLESEIETLNRRRAELEDQLSASEVEVDHAGE